MDQYVESHETCIWRVSPIFTKNGNRLNKISLETNNLDQLCDVQVMFGLVSLLCHFLIKLPSCEMCMFVISQLQFQFVSWIYFNYIVIRHLHFKGMHSNSSMVSWIAFMVPFPWDGSQMWTLELITCFGFWGSSYMGQVKKTKPLVTYLLSFMRFM